MNIGKIEVNYESEETAGTEDRVFADRQGNWYWQARGTTDCWGPFTSKEEAKADYARS